MKAYYNEIDPHAAAWLRQLIKDGLITDGVVDERSIIEVEPIDFAGFDRCHFFAGIGVWDHCLDQAGWGDRPVWTASLPCQPFSQAGKCLGKADKRHLLPHFLDLVRKCRPDVIFGEQVERAIRHGWLDDLHAEMGRENYAVGHVVFGAHSVNLSHIRQRLYWMANAINHSGEWPLGRVNEEKNRSENENRENVIVSGQSGGTGEYVHGMANSNEQGLERRERAECTDKLPSGENGLACRMGKSHSDGREQGSKTAAAARYGRAANTTGWSDCDWLYCRDGKYRPIESGTSAMVDGTSKGVVYSGDPCQPIDADCSIEARKMRLRGYGNAIVADCGTAFISAYLDYLNDT